MEIVPVSLIKFCGMKHIPWIILNLNNVAKFETSMIFIESLAFNCKILLNNLDGR